ncbi:unnamed protein product [Mortierella alpina]
MLAPQSPPEPVDSQRHYHGADKETHQIHIQVGTHAIACIRQQDAHGLAILKELLNTHDNVPAHLRGFIHVEREAFNLHRDSVHSAEKGRAVDDPHALDWYFMSYCKAHKCPTKAAKIKVGGPYKNNGMLTLQFLNNFCDHTNEQARAQQRKGVSTAKRKRSGRIAARTKSTTPATTVEPQDRSCSPKLEVTEPPGASRVRDAPRNNEMKRTRWAGRGDSEDTTLNERPFESMDRPRRSRITYGSGRHSRLQSTRTTAASSQKPGEPAVARQPSPCVQVVIPSMSRIKPEPSHDHDDSPDHTSSVSSRANEFRSDTPLRSTDAFVGTLRNASSDPSKDEVLKASDILPTDPSPSLGLNNTDSTITKHPSVVSGPSLQSKTSRVRDRAVEPGEPCRSMDPQKRPTNLQQSSVDHSLENEHGLSAEQQQQPHRVTKDARRSAGGSARPTMEPRTCQQGGLLTPTPSLTSFEAPAPDPSSSSASGLSPQSVASLRKASSAKPQPPPPLTCARTTTPSGSGRLCSVSLRCPTKWLTQVPIAISPTTTFEDLLQHVIRDVQDSLQLPLGMRWSIRSQDLSQQYLLNARVAETIGGVEHAALVIMTEQRADLHLEDF